MSTPQRPTRTNKTVKGDNVDTTGAVDPVTDKPVTDESNTDESNTDNQPEDDSPREPSVGQRLTAVEDALFGVGVRPVYPDSEEE